MGRPVHFEISADDPERAAAFYAQALGWTVTHWQAPEGPDYWLISTGEGVGIDGGMSVRGEHSFPGTTNTVQVQDLDATLGAVEAAGGTVLMSRMQIPGVGHLAYCCDLDGNAFGVMQPVEAA